MANIKKTFNFRNGVQVDDDNLIVNQTGLVGIGTTVPTEALDVRGKVKVLVDPNVAGSGEINATTGIITSLTVTNLTVSGNDYSGGVIGVNKSSSFWQEVNTSRSVNSGRIIFFIYIFLH